MKHSLTSRWLLALAAFAALSSNSQAGDPVSAKAPTQVVTEAAVDWKVNTISPVANPLFFEDPVIRNEIRPVFVHHRIDPSFVTGDGEAQLYALQLRFAITERLAFIAAQDGYMDISTEGLGDLSGWMDLAAGFKYALIDDKENEFILTPGFTFFIPVGDEEVFQGKGSGEWNLFVSAAKGFDRLHLTGNVGVRLPHESDAQSTMLHYSLMADYYTCRYFIPFVVANAWTVVSEGNGIALDSEGYDVINFGSSRAGGTTQMTVGAGFRSRILDNVDFGVAYEKAVLSPEGLTDDRLTVDLSIRF
jgi:hypothetical protein